MTDAPDGDGIEIRSFATYTETWIMKSFSRRRKVNKQSVSKLRRAKLGNTLRFEALEERRLLAVLTVQNDRDDTLSNLAGDGELSFREAIEIANNPGTTIDGFSSSHVTDTINFAPLVFDTGIAQVIGLTSQLPTITSDLTINGPGANLLTIDAQNNGYRVFEIDDATSAVIKVLISGLTLTGGNISGIGGAILSHENLTVTNSTISGNTARDFGGAIMNFGVLTVRNSTLSSNTLTGSGRGGGIFNSGTATVTNSTLSGNTASDQGGGIYNASGKTATVTNSTLSGNTAAFRGGGIYVKSGDVTLNSSIVANSSGGDIDGAGALFLGLNGSNNLIEDGSGSSLLSNTVTGDPLLGPLTDNGGPTPTHSLLPGSPALDQGSSSLDLDQRGLTRPVDLGGVANFGDGSDIGAFEARELPSFVVTTKSDVVNDTDQLTSLREAIGFANDLPGSNTITFSALVFTGGDESLIRLTGGELEITDTLVIDASTATGVTITGDAAGNDVTDVLNITNVAASVGMLGDNTRVLNFTNTSGNLTVEDLTITGGRTTGDDQVDETTHNGGGVRFLSTGSLTLTGSTVSGNSTEGERAVGGGIFAHSGSVNLIGSTVSGNSTEGERAYGGGISTYSGSVTLTNSTVSGNRVTGSNSGGAGVDSSAGRARTC